MASQLLDSISDRNIPHIVGGVFPTNAPDIVINHPSVNVLARHEGEITVTDAITVVADVEVQESVPIFLNCAVFSPLNVIALADAPSLESSTTILAYPASGQSARVSVRSPVTVPV